MWDRDVGKKQSRLHDSSEVGGKQDCKMGPRLAISMVIAKLMDLVGEANEEGTPSKLQALLTPAERIASSANLSRVD